MRLPFLLAAWLLTSVAPIAARSIELGPEALQTPPPNIIRTCCAFGADLSVARIPFMRKSDITAVALLGTHEYLGGKFEGNGIVYTRRGGFLDIGHLRDYVDWTAYLYARMVDAKANSSLIALDLGHEGGHKNLTIDVSKLPREVTMTELAGKIAFDLSTWHEIATWFGASYIPLVPERYSSFSPEDLYSNLLGVKIGIAAIQSELPFEAAVDQILARYLETLEAVHSVEETLQALSQVEEIWWTKTKALPSAKVILRRNVDADLVLTPWLVPTDEVRLVPHVLALSSPNLNAYYDFSIKTNGKIGLKKILPQLASESECIDQEDFAALLSYIATNQLPAEGHAKRRRLERRELSGY